MAENPESPLNSEVEKFLKDLEYVAPEHRVNPDDPEDETIKPEHLNEEISTKIGRITVTAFRWQRGENKDLVGELEKAGLLKIKEMFPEKQEFIRQVLEKTESLKSYTNLFEEDESQE